MSSYRYPSVVPDHERWCALIVHVNSPNISLHFAITKLGDARTSKFRETLTNRGKGTPGVRTPFQYPSSHFRGHILVGRFREAAMVVNRNQGIWKAQPSIRLEQ
jgi:hypothetical protein